MWGLLGQGAGEQFATPQDGHPAAPQNIEIGLSGLGARLEVLDPSSRFSLTGLQALPPRREAGAPAPLTALRRPIDASAVIPRASLAPTRS